MNILVLCPMSIEYSNFNMALKSCKSQKLKHSYKACCCGVGKVESAMEVTAKLADDHERSKYEHVVLIGYAGGYNLERGSFTDVYKCRYSDVNVPLLSEECAHLTKEYPLDGMTELTIYTADSFIQKEDIARLREKYQFRQALFDMEATAVAQVCEAYSRSLTVIKMISDLPEEDTSQSFEDFVNTHSDFMPFIKFMELL